MKVYTLYTCCKNFFYDKYHTIYYGETRTCESSKHFMSSNHFVSLLRNENQVSKPLYRQGVETVGVGDEEKRNQ